MKKHVVLIASLAATAVLALASKASATAIPINLAAFSGSQTIMTFEDRNAAANGTVLPAGYGLSSGIHFSPTTESYHYSSYGALAASATANGLGAVAATFGCNGGCGTGFDFLLNDSETNVGFWIGSNVNIANMVISAYLNGNLLGSQTLNVAANLMAFVGFQDPGGIDQIVIGNSSNCGGDCIHQLDNVMFEGSASSVPEPASLILLGSGLIGAGMRRRRLKRNG